MARSSSGSKRWGQHFLKSRRIAARIVEALEIRPSDLVIEIGPGKGILTGILLQSPAKVIGVEIDPGLACYLKDRLPKLEILSTDFLKLDL
ncbi:16S rRNA (adenine(1518)-N(6)/adenine(1519)-N(6))-dimethyltransferase, partial [candidate division WOR-3 bacterium]